MKIHKKLFSVVYQLTSHFLLGLYLQNYKEFEAEILDLKLGKYGLSFDIKKYTTSGWALGDENVIGIRSFNIIITSYYKKQEKIEGVCSAGQRLEKIAVWEQKTKM